MSADLRDGIIAREQESELLRLARESGFITMFEDGLVKAAEGQTSIAEIMRVLGGAAPARPARQAVAN